jgi:hypothetical protein
LDGLLGQPTKKPSSSAVAKSFASVEYRIGICRLLLPVPESL